jgi:hypothetical protein
MRIISSSLIALLLISCNSSHYRDVFEFNLHPNALKDGEEVKILAAIIGPGDNQKKEYYNQLIVVSIKSGDTFNILVPFNPALTKQDQGKIFNYFNSENPINNIDDNKIKPNQENIRIEDIQSKFPEYDKVYQNAEFNDIAINTFPTVKGSVGTKGN